MSNTVLNSETDIEKLFLSVLPKAIGFVNSASVDISTVYVAGALISSTQFTVNAGLFGKAKFKKILLIPGVFKTNSGSGLVIVKLSSTSQAPNNKVIDKNK